MKNTIITAVAACLLTLGLTPAAEARHPHQTTTVYVSGYRSCGTPIYTERRLCGYDRYGRPVWNYRVLSTRDSHRYHHSYDRGRRNDHRYYGRGNHHDYRYGYGNGGCSPRGGYGHGGVVIRF